MHSQEDQVGAMLAELVILTILLQLYLLTKFIELIVRVLAAHPECKVVWIALGFALFCILLVGATAGEIIYINSLCIASLFILFVTAKAAEVYYSTMVEPEVGKEELVDNVLHSPWWNAKAA